MRAFLAGCTAVCVMALAYWAYMENFRTHQSLRTLDRLNGQIARQTEALTMLRAEWAYLNRPDRLRDLAEINFSDLTLTAMVPEHFGEVEQVAYPPLPLFDMEQVFGTMTLALPGRPALDDTGSSQQGAD